jgi:hypothetical protein
MSTHHELSINPPEKGLVIVTAAGEGYVPSARVAAALDDLSEALAEAEGREVSGFKLFGNLFGSGPSTTVNTGAGDDDNDTVKVKIKPGGSCNLSIGTVVAQEDGTGDYMPGRGF